MFKIKLKTRTLKNILEPVSSTAPKFPMMAESFKSRLLQNVDMLCPAQGYPVPTHRYSSC